VAGSSARRFESAFLELLEAEAPALREHGARVALELLPPRGLRRPVKTSA
jgi:hypothetical protein